MNENTPQTSSPAPHLTLAEPAVATPSTPEPGSGTAPAYGTPPAPTTGPVSGPPRQPSVAWQPAQGAPTQAERTWALAAHLSGFVAAWVALGFLGPLAVLLTGGTTSPFVRRHAVEALNFNLSVLIYLAVSALLMLVLVGFVLVPVVGLVYLVATVLGALAASRGEDYRYPLTIRFVR